MDTMSIESTRKWIPFEFRLPYLFVAVQSWDSENDEVWIILTKGDIGIACSLDLDVMTMISVS